MKYTTTSKGVVAELNGRFFGIQYEDGHSTEYGFGPVEHAKISSAKWCHRPRDMTYEGSPYIQELDKAKLVHIVITTIYETTEA